MSSTTTNYNLNKPDKGFKGWDVSVNNNFDIIDTEIKNRANDITIANNKVGNLSTLTTDYKTDLVGAMNEHETQINTNASLLASKVNQIDLDYANAYSVKVRAYIHKQMLGLSAIRSITVIGDSITNGEGVTNEYQQYATMLKNSIYGMQNGNGAVYELISNFQYKKSSSDITYSGTYSFTENIPNGDCDSITLQVGAAINFTRDINNIILYFNRSASAGSVAIYQDGTLKQTISLSGADAKHVMTASNDFRGGSHLYSIQCTGAPVTITGLGAFKNTNQSNLITFHRLGYSGKTLYEFQNTSALDFINKVGKYGSNPSVTIVELGTNDIFNSNCTPSQFQTRLQATAQGLVSAGNYVYLCVPYIPDPTTHPVNQGQNFQDFRKIYYTVAKAVGCGVIDLSIMDFVGNGWLSADGLHPNESGHAAIAKTICDALGIQQKGFMQLQKYTLNMTDISSSGANSSKFIVLGSIPYDSQIVNIMIRNKTNGLQREYRELADYANGYGLVITKGLNAEPRWALYKLSNGALKIQSSDPTGSYLSTTDSDNEVIISYLF